MSICPMTTQLPPTPPVVSAAHTARKKCGFHSVTLPVRLALYVSVSEALALSTSFAHSFSLSPNHFPPAASSNRSLIQFRKSIDCISDEPNYRGCCQCGQSGPEWTHSTPTPSKIDHLFKFSEHLEALSILKCLEGWFWHQGGYYPDSTLVSAPTQVLQCFLSWRQEELYGVFHFRHFLKTNRASEIQRT